ncbi:MAG: ABC transporter substrate-binding protein, partial [Rickettsiales bacterium]|nr:ABC transporter substrate-binding protein [Rickettsiales bacterium]
FPSASISAECPDYATCSHGLSIWGDLKYPKDFDHFDYTNPAAPNGGRIRYAETGTFDSLNKFILKGVDAAGLDLIYDTLLTSSYDEPFSEYGLLAETVTLAKDRSWVIFDLRKQAKWHDGTPITAEDVAFTFHTLMEKGHPYYRAYYAEISGVEVLGKHRVKFTFANKDNRELPLIIGQLPILPKHYYDTQDFEVSTLNPPLGSGPYRIDGVEAGKWLQYRRVEDYWGKDLPVNRGRNNIDILRYDYYRDAAVAVEAFKAGEYDFRLENMSKIWATAYNDFPALAQGRVKKERLRHELPSGMQGYVFNTRRPMFADRRVRKAIALAFDFEWSNRNLFYDEYQRTTSFFANSDFAASGTPSPAERALLEPFRDQLPEAVFAEAYTPPVTDGSGNIRTLLLEADHLLKEAGWVVRDGVRVNAATGEPLTFEFLFISPAFERVTGPYIRNLKRLGINARMRVVDSSQYARRVEDFDYDIIINVYGQSLSPGNEQVDYWHSAKADVKGSRNLAGIRNPAVDAMIEALLKAKSREKQLTALHALDRILLAEHYLIPHFHSRYFRILYRNAYDRPQTPPKYNLGLDLWWANPEKEACLQQPGDVHACLEKAESH